MEKSNTMTSQIQNITITDYSERSFVVRGEGTKEHKDALKQMGGKWNSNLRDGGGWIYPMTKKPDLQKWKSSGILNSEMKYYSSSSSSTSSSSYSPSSKTPSISNESLMKEMKVMSKKIDKLEKLIESLTSLLIEEEGEEYEEVVEYESSGEGGVEESKEEVDEDGQAAPKRRLLR